MYIYKGKEIAAIDAKAVRDGLDAMVLMETAGRALYEALAQGLEGKRILILAGRGNNGGDGIVLARYLLNNGYDAEIVFPFGASTADTASKHLAYFKNCGYSESSRNGHYDVIIDALFGAGTRLPLPEEVTSLLLWANAQEARRIAIDLPTGVESDAGAVETAFRANETYVLHGFKPSAFLEPSIDFYGKKHLLDIGLPQASCWKVWTKEDVQSTFHQRSPGSHKGTFGNGLLLAGSDEMPGSAMLAALGAMRAGIGKLTIGTTRHAAGIIAGRVPECTYMLEGLEAVRSGESLGAFSAAAIGPGLLDEDSVEEALHLLFEEDFPIIIDAGALKARNYPERKAPIILTPHPGEFSRMTGVDAAAIQNNRLRFAQDYAAEHHVIVVLKGRNTVIAFPDGEVIVNRTGNQALSKGGTGDTLTGILLAFLSFYENTKEAVANAVYFHGACADRYVAGHADGGMLASDISELLPEVMHAIVEDFSKSDNRDKEELS